MNQKTNLFRSAASRHISPRWKYRILSWLSRGCRKGRGSYVHPSVQILGEENVSIGSNTFIGEQTWLNVNHRIRGETVILVGDNCFIGRRNFFSSGKRIEMGDYVLTSLECKFVCSSHDVGDPLVPYLASGATSGGIIRIGVNCFFGTGAMVLGDVKIGHGSVVGAGALVTKDVPAFCMVVGNPARILRRYSFSKKSWIEEASVSAEDLKENPDEEAYLELLRKGYPKIEMPVIAAGGDLGSF